MRTREARWILLLLLICHLSLVAGFAAVGDKLGLEIQTNGTRILASIAGLNIQGGFSNGFATNNSITGGQKLTLSVVRTGYTASAATTLVTNPVYGTIIERLVWPNDGTNNIVANGDGAIAGIWLSDNILSGDTVTASALAGYYFVTNGSGTNANAFTSQPVTNSSTQPHVQAIANWSPRTPRYQRVTNVMRLSVVAFHGSGRNRKPVQLVRFITTGQTSGAKVTNDVLNMTVDTEWYAQSPYWNVYTNIGNVKAGEFNANVDLSGMTTNEIVRSDFQVYPILGDATAVVDTTLNTYPIWSPLPTQIQNRYDPNNVHSRCVAIVHDTLGTNASGLVLTNGDYTSIPATAYFNTFGAALNAMAGTNNTFFGHNDVSGGTIYYVSTNFPGATITATAIPSVAPILRPLPGSPSTFTHTTGSSASFKRIRFIGGNQAWAASQIPFTSYDWLAFEDFSNIVSSVTSPGAYNTCTNIVILRSRIGSISAGLIAASSANVGPGVSLQGVDLKHFNQATYFRTWIAVVHPDTNGGSYTVRSQLANSDPTGYEILYNCYLDGFDTSGAGIFVANEGVTRIGMAVCNNFLGKTSGNNPIAAVGSGATFTNATNIIFWCNTVDGGRIADWASNGTSETNVVWRKNWSTVGNVWAYPGQKDDTDSPQSTNRYGGWDIASYMVAARGNFYMRNAQFPTGIAFRPRFAGPWTHDPDHTNVANYARFILRKAAGINSTTEGNGNYRVFTDSPLLHHSLRGWNSPLPFDILGNARGDCSPPGAYAEANPAMGL